MSLLQSCCRRVELGTNLDSFGTLATSLHCALIMASGPVTSWQIDGEIVETVADFFFGGGSKITVSFNVMTTAMTLKDAYSLEGKL